MSAQEEAARFVAAWQRMNQRQRQIFGEALKLAAAGHREAAFQLLDRELHGTRP